MRNKISRANKQEMIEKYQQQQQLITHKRNARNIFNFKYFSAIFQELMYVPTYLLVPRLCDGILNKLSLAGKRKSNERKFCVTIKSINHSIISGTNFAGVLVLVCFKLFLLL